MRWLLVGRCYASLTKYMYWVRLFGLNACSEDYSIRDMALIKRRTLLFRNYLNSVDYGCNYVVDLGASEVTNPSEGGSPVRVHNPSCFVHKLRTE